MLTQKEAQKLITDVAVIKTQVGFIHDEVNPEVKKNTKFRLYLTGFIIIGLPIMGIVMRLL